MDNHYLYPNACLAIMAKAPVAGCVKTRMQPHLTPHESANLQANLIEHSIEKCRLSRVAPIQLWCAPNTRYNIFQKQVFHAQLHQQAQGSLGDRMKAVFEHNQAKQFTLIIGTDAPLLTHQDLIDAGNTCAQQIDQSLVIEPATDGGYVLIGAQSTPPCFDQIDWGSERVLKQTIEHLERHHWQAHRLSTRPDLDTFNDLEQLPSDLRQRLTQSHTDTITDK